MGLAEPPAVLFCMCRVAGKGCSLVLRSSNAKHVNAVKYWWIANKIAILNDARKASALRNENHKRQAQRVRPVGACGQGGARGGNVGKSQACPYFHADPRLSTGSSHHLVSIWTPKTRTASPLFPGWRARPTREAITSRTMRRYACFMPPIMLSRRAKDTAAQFRKLRRESPQCDPRCDVIRYRLC